MNVWVVEDNAEDAAIATELVAEVASEQGTPVQVHWDRTIVWQSPLTPPPPSKENSRAAKELHPPDIVILDLFDADGEFRAEEFLRQLRHWEIARQSAPAWIILWSVYTGVNEVQEFIACNTERDRRVVFSGSKQAELLRIHLTHCWRSWKEAQYP